MMGINKAVPLALAASLSLGISACTKATDSAGASKPSTSTCVEDTATKALAADAAAPSSTPDLAPVDGAAANGKTIEYVASGLSFSYSQEVLAGVKEAAAAVDATVSVSDSGGDPTKAATLVDQAVAKKVDAIILQGTPPKTIASSVQNAKANGIPLIETADDPGAISDELKELGVTGNATGVDDLGTRQANFVAADSGCDADVLFLGTSTFGDSNTSMISQFQNRLGELCPDCTVTVQDAPLAQWSTTLQGQVRTFLQKNPDVTYVVENVDALDVAVKPAVTSFPGRALTVVGNNATEGALQGLGTAGDSGGATIGTNLYQLGWALVDQAIRGMAGVEAEPDEQVPNRTFTRDNIGEINLDEESWTYYGDVDFRKFYTGIWGQ
jgi:ribose transport system substrate-binding protein